MVSKLVFSPEMGDFVPVEEAERNFVQSFTDVDGEDEVAVTIVDGEDTGEYVAGGNGLSTLQPPETFYVNTSLTKTRTNPDGSTSVDIVIEIDDGTQEQYDIRVTKN